ncbi:phosphatidylcholine-sterol acyltransferase, putative [Plasmodium reichenowi]|uniref:Phosphatidylcholine-sterol acyltransferase, putative n=1 Tax=Plasmodium reichenowi TaxID=5854 RepID=A0A151LPR7_PLARE|nr:phosphatidylcholine-sterol acyltransferase, putative [Plasmodium reichenowi]KYO01172.1 phosphatidylcholine-sterol acyltransferase, putative [Plasmodium reichenowi]
MSSILLFIIVFQYLLISFSGTSYKRFVADGASIFLRNPYKITLGKSEKRGKVFSEFSEEEDSIVRRDTEEKKKWFGKGHDEYKKVKEKKNVVLEGKQIGKEENNLVEEENDSVGQENHYVEEEDNVGIVKKEKDEKIVVEKEKEIGVIEKEKEIGVIEKEKETGVIEREKETGVIERENISGVEVNNKDSQEDIYNSNVDKNSFADDNNRDDILVRRKKVSNKDSFFMNDIIRGENEDDDDNDNNDDNEEEDEKVTKSLENVKLGELPKLHYIFGTSITDNDDDTEIRNESEIDDIDELDEEEYDWTEHVYNYKPTTYLLPGLGGSTLIAEYKNATIHSCSRYILNSKPFRIWISLSRLLSIQSNIYCTFDTIRLKYDEKKNIYYNQPGVFIDVEKFGNLKGIEYLDYFNNTGIGITKYFNVVGQYFTSHGYVDGESIIGAPYDWRYPLSQQNYKILKEHIEYIYEKRNGTKVNLIGHSLGGLYLNFFLSRIVSKKWKQKHLNKIIFISTPFKGSVKTIRALIQSRKDFISFRITKLIKLSIPESMMKALGNSLGSLFDILPYREYYKRDQVVILINMSNTPIDEDHVQYLVTLCGIYKPECYRNREDVNLKVYTLENWHELLDDKLKAKYENYKLYRERYYNKDHGVPIYCLYSTINKKETEYLLYFETQNTREEPIIYYGTGDGTVGTESLQACSNFYNTVLTHHFSDTSHVGILYTNETAKYIYDIVQSPN